MDDQFESNEDEGPSASGLVRAGLGWGMGNIECIEDGGGGGGGGKRVGGGSDASLMGEPRDSATFS